MLTTKKELIYHSAVHSGVVVDTCFRYLALVGSSSDLELDHLCLELKMKGATAVFVLNRLLVLKARYWVGMGFSHMHFDTCVCESICVCVSL